MSTNSKAVLFDLDGVLIDTEGTYSEFWTRMGQKYNVAYPDFADRIKGTTLPNILATYFPEDKHEEINRILDDFEHTMQYSLFPGVIEMLERLKGTPCAIVTSSGEEKMRRLFEQHPKFQGYFQAVITDKDITHSKPDPEPYLVAAHAVNTPIENCIVLEDSINGIISAERAGAFIIAVASTLPVSILRQHTRYVVPSIVSLL